MSAAYFSNCCGRSYEVKRDTFAPCGLLIGHEGKCEPVKVGRQAARESPRSAEHEQGHRQ